jgi:uncharacterized cupredoxin-like copper-binding protein
VRLDGDEMAADADDGDAGHATGTYMKGGHGPFAAPGRCLCWAGESHDGQGGPLDRDLRRRRVAIIASLVAALSLVAAACGSDSSDHEGRTTRESTVDVTLQEFAVRPEQDSAPAGDVTFNVGNVGPEDTHEFVVFKTDLAADALPTSPNGSVDETGKGVELIGEIEDIAPGDTPPPLTVSLDAGSYVFICNIVEEEGQDTIVHYQQGMRTGFTVE